MSFKLLGERIAVDADPIKEQNEAGLFLPGSAQPDLRYGTVVNVGVGRRNEAGELVPIDFKVGDRVFFNFHAGQKLEIEGHDEMLFLTAHEIIGVVEAAKLKAV